MSSAPWWSGTARLILATAGIVGVFLAADALFVALLIVVGAIIGGELNPYTGLLLFMVVPVLVAAGGGAAWGAYRLWQLVPRGGARGASVKADTFVMRT